MYAFKYLHLCPTLQTKFNSIHFKNLKYSICFIDIGGGSLFSRQLKYFFYFGFQILLNF